MQENLNLHDYALKLARDYLRTECLLIEVLDEIDCTLLYRALGYSSLFTYAVSALGLSEATAYAMISVARKSREVKKLREALAAQQLSVSKAAKIVSTLDVNNAEELIAFAQTHTSREIEAEVARRQGRAKEQVRKLEIPVSVLENLKRAQSVLSTKRGCAVDQVATLEDALDEYLDRHDPVRKADRAMRRKATQGAGRATNQTSSQPMAQAANPMTSHAAPGAQPESKFASKPARDCSREEKSDRRRPVRLMKPTPSMPEIGGGVHLSMLMA